jgi:hypothetical protein
MRVAVVGASTFPLSRGAGHILRVMKKLPKGTIIIVRGKHTVGDKVEVPLQGADSMAAAFGRVLGFEVVVAGLSEPGKVTPALRGWARDTVIAEVAEHVICFFDPERGVVGGTHNLMSLALSKDKEVEAYTLDDDDNLVSVAET